MKKKFFAFFLISLSLMQIICKSDDNSQIWDFSLSGRNQKMTIIISDTLIRNIPVIRYREIHTINPLLNVDLYMNKETQIPMSFFITAVGENVEICDSAHYYSISKTFNGTERLFRIDYDTVAFPFYGRYAIPILKKNNGHYVEKLYMAKGYTVLYNFELWGEEILSINGEDAACDVWKLSALTKDFPFQPVDLLWIRKAPPFDLLQIKMNIKEGRVFGFKFGNRNVLYKRDV